MRQDLPRPKNITIAKPCPASWDDMKGDDRVRHCSLCNLNVYNIASMTPEAAERLLDTDKRLCVRIYQREDGTVMTADCPKGLAAVRRRVAISLASVASLFIVGFTFMAPRTKEQNVTARDRYQKAVDYVENMEPIKTWIGKKDPPPEIMGKMVAGAVAPRGPITFSKSGKP